MSGRFILLNTASALLMTIGSFSFANNVIPFPTSTSRGHSAEAAQENLDLFITRLSQTFRNHDGVLLSIEVSDETGEIKAHALKPDVDEVYKPPFFDFDFKFIDTPPSETRVRAFVTERIEYFPNLPHSLTRIKTTTGPRFKTVEKTQISFSNISLIHSYSVAHYKRTPPLNQSWHSVPTRPKGEPSIEMQKDSYAQADPVDLKALAKYREAVVRPSLRGEKNNVPLDGWGIVIPVDFSSKGLSCKSLL